MKCPNCQTENLSDSRFCHKCATLLKDDHDGFSTIKTQSQTFDISRGDLFAGRYEIIEELGQGGMGKVYKAFDHKIKEIVALKLIRPEISVNDKAIDRFRNELKVARKISHRNICRMYDLGEEGFLHYITMEYVAGEDLKRFIKRAGTLTSGKAIYLARQVSEGLAEAHRLGVIHRDLKPQNIMIDLDGNARIMDFGIARFVDTDRMTGSGVMIGTPEYMSPEQAELKEVDKRADIYSLGVVLYEMVTGRVPFEGETPLSVAMKHKTETPKNVRELNALISVGLSKVILKCMEKDPNKRYQSSEELVENLKQVEQGLSTSERVVPKKEPISTREIKLSFSLKKLLLPAGAVIFLIIAMLAIWKFMPGKKNEPLAVQTESQSTEANLKEEKPTDLKDEKPAVLKAEKPAVLKGQKPAVSPPPPEIKKEKSVADSGSIAAQNKEDQKMPIEQPKAASTNDDAQAVGLAMARLTAAKSQAQDGGFDEKALFFRMAKAKEQEAQKYLTQKNYSEARALFPVAERLYRINLERNEDGERLKILKRFVETLKDRVGKKPSTTQEAKLYAYAQEYEKQGSTFLANKDFANSAKTYTQAAVFYEKILLVLQPTKKE